MGKARRRLAAELVCDVERIHARDAAAIKELPQLLAAIGITLTGLHRIDPSGAARQPLEAGDITRFPDNDRFASWTCTARSTPRPGDHTRRQLSAA